MKQKSVITLDDAHQILDAAQKEAESQGWNVSIAVVDDGGHLVALRRLDGCSPMGSYVATEKARSAALGGKETQVFEDMINGGRAAFLSVPELKGTMTGGVPVIFQSFGLTCQGDEDIVAGYAKLAENSDAIIGFELSDVFLD